MSDPCLVDWCSRPVGDGYVCETCSEKLRIALGDVSSLWDDLDAVLALQARYSTPEGRGGDKALPFNPEASEIGWVLRNTLETWCLLVAEARGIALPSEAALLSRRQSVHTAVKVAHKPVVRCEFTLLPLGQCGHCSKAGVDEVHRHDR